MQIKYDRKLNLEGFVCPLPVLKTQQALQDLKSGEILWVMADDPQTRHDLPVLVEEHKYILRALYLDAQTYHFLIEKS